MRIELVFQHSMHQVFSMKCSQNTHLQGYSPDDPMIQLSWFCMMASGTRQLDPFFGCRRSDDFCYCLPDFISSRSKIVNQLRRYALQVSTVFNFPHAFQLLPQPVVTRNTNSFVSFFHFRGGCDHPSMHS